MRSGRANEAERGSLTGAVGNICIMFKVARYGFPLLFVYLNKIY